MHIRKILLSLLILAIAAPAIQAQRRPLPKQEADSVATALGVIWGNYMRQKSTRDGEAVSREYMRGVLDVLNPTDRNDAYIIGVEQGLVIADRLNQVEKLGNFDIDRDLFLRSLRKYAEGKHVAFTPETAHACLNVIMGKRAIENNNIDRSPSYLKEQEKREGVIKTPSGLLFEVLTEGEGAKPGPNDMVMVNYSGRLIDGSQFNASEPGQPAIFEVAGTIPGFAEGLQMMKKGGKYRIFIPASIGYGDEGVVGVIPPGAATVFDVELLDIRTEEQLKQDAQKMQEAAAAAAAQEQQQTEK